jgi:hypothetical protein
LDSSKFYPTRISAKGTCGYFETSSLEMDIGAQTHISGVRLELDNKPDLEEW